MGTQLPFVTVGGGVAVLAVSVYASRTCVVLTDFLASCWGANEQGARTHALLPGRGTGRWALGSYCNG
eukprot:2221969-Rhodomonas_salina.1